MRYVVPVTAGNGHEAIAAADRMDPDLVLMDIRLNGQPDGIETARRIRSRKNVPVIYVTAYGDDDTLRRAKVGEPFGYVLKPFEDHDLRIAIETGLHRHRVEAHQLADEQRQFEQEKLKATGQLAGGFAHYYNALLTVILGNAELARRGLHKLTDMSASARDILRVVERLTRLVEAMPESDKNARALRTLVAVLQGNADLLKRDMFSQTEVPDMITGIIHAGQQAQRLTEDLLAFATRESRKDVTVDVHAVIDQVAADLRAHAVQEGFQIRRDLRATAATVTGDPAHLLAAIMNLATNARDALAGRGKITFATDVVDFGVIPGAAEDSQAISGDFLNVAVIDDGVGMAKQTLKRACEPFFTTKDQTKCPGLGLSAAYGIAHSHGGSMRVESQPGKGTKVVLLLPLA